MEEYLAHIDQEGNGQTLKVHMEGVSHLAGSEGAKLGIGHITGWIGLLHDLGKYKDRFQEYIRDETGKIPKGSVNHASAGAEFLMRQYGQTSDRNMRLFVELISYVISAHHGLYDSVSAEGVDIFTKRLGEAEDRELQQLFCRWSGELDLNPETINRYMKSACEEFKNQFLKKYREIRNSNESEYLFYVGCFERLLLSIQIDSDWTDTAEAMEGGGVGSGHSLGAREIFTKAWENYQCYMKELNYKSDKSNMSEQEIMIHNLRNQIQAECLEFTTHGSGIYCLPIPTGGGKTLTSLGYALKYAAERVENPDQIERFFYISPYISITEQNAQVIKEAIGNSNWVLEHHSNVINSDETGENEFETSWEERFICTTMVQFLYTLFSEKKKSIRRFHKLKHAVIVIDEIQSIPVKTIHLFNLMINFLNQICHTTIILCTATQPALDSEFIKRKIQYSDPRNMITDIDIKFKQFERVQIACAFSTEKDTFESLEEKVQNEFNIIKSVLIIFNKKQMVSDFYDKMKEKLTDVDIFYLTTNLCAEHRSERIHHIKELLKKKERKVLVISTNLIEAGVDLSVECIYRSLTGLDSIAQAAGRCNRNGEMEKGCVTVFELSEDKPGKHMDELLIAQKKTREVVYSHNIKQAKESIIFPRWIEQFYVIFYEELKNRMDFNLKDQYKGETIFGLLSNGFTGGKSSHIIRQAFETAGENYQVMENTEVTVIVPYKEGNNLIAELENCTERHSIRRCLKKMQWYTVSVYGYKKEELIGNGVVRPSTVLPDVLIASGYDLEKGLVNELPIVIF